VRKFNHKKALEVAFNILYVVSFLAIVLLGYSNASEDNLDSRSGATEYYDCMNCDEID
tara:strand:- start:177 stop:350 length:174 start_codon:yes stop_codon:yes gene_type:complete